MASGRCGGERESRKGPGDGGCHRLTAFLPLPAETIYPGMTPSSSPAPDIWLHHLEDEADAAFLYRELAQAERDTHKADLYRKLAQVEDRHVEMWRKLLAE